MSCDGVTNEFHLPIKRGATVTLTVTYPAVMLVTVPAPALIDVGSHCCVELFHASACPFVGAVEATARPWMPSTTGDGYDPDRSPPADPVAVVTTPLTDTLGAESETVIAFTTGETVTWNDVMGPRCCSG